MILVEETGQERSRAVEPLPTDGLDKRMSDEYLRTLILSFKIQWILAYATINLHYLKTFSERLCF